MDVSGVKALHWDSSAHAAMDATLENLMVNRIVRMVLTESAAVAWWKVKDGSAVSESVESVSH
jgi:hypothetical protein